MPTSIQGAQIQSAVARRVKNYWTCLASRKQASSLRLPNQATGSRRNVSVFAAQLQDSSRSKASNAKNQFTPVASNFDSRRSVSASSSTMPITGLTNTEGLFVLPEPPTMTCSGTAASAWSGDVLFVGLKEDSYDGEGKALSADAKAALEGFGDGVLATIMDTLDDDEFKLKPGSSKVFSTCGAASAKHICLIGLGSLEESAKKWGKSAWQVLGATMKSVAKTNKCASAALVTPGVASPSVEDIGNGLLVGAYESTRFKSKQKGNGGGLKSVEVLGSVADFDAKVAQSTALAQGITVGRYLVEAPPNVASPQHLAECAQMIKDTYPDLFELKVYKACPTTDYFSS